MVFKKEELQIFLSGGIAGMCSKTAVAPLDRMKILLQAHNSHYKNLGVWSGLKAIVKNESFWALYKGNGAQMVRIFPYAATQFTAFNLYQKYFQKFLSGKDSSIGTFIIKFGSGACAGSTAVALTYPLDTIRARLAFQVTGEHVYSGIWDAGKTIFRTEGGIVGLYRGFLPTLCGIFLYAGNSFSCFGTLKDFFMGYMPTDAFVLKYCVHFVCGGLAGAVAQTVSYPLDVVRRRMQLAMMNPETAKFGQGMWSTLVLTYKENGIVRGLYRGMSINFYRACPMVAVSFSTYEGTLQFLQSVKYFS